MRNYFGLSCFGFAAFLVGVLAVSVRATEELEPTPPSIEMPKPQRAPCVRGELATFLSKGKPVASEVISTEDRWNPDCSFGGNKVYTPKFKLYVYVNFNIKCVDDLDAIDASFEKHALGRPHGDFILDRDRGFGIAFVKEPWFRDRIGAALAPGVNAGLPYSRTTLFVSENAFQNNELPQIWEEYFANGENWSIAPLPSLPSEPAKDPRVPARLGAGPVFQRLPERVKIALPRFP